MLMLRKIIKILITLVFSANNLFAQDIPIIVISPGKTVQSLSTVGSAIEVFTSDTINNSSHFSLHKCGFIPLKFVPIFLFL